MLKSLVTGSIFVGTVLGIGNLTSAAQTLSADANLPAVAPATAQPFCAKSPVNDAMQAFRLVCQRGAEQKLSDSSSAGTIVIGFVGGFVKADDTSHPEVLFASYLQERYPSGVSVKVFSNHDEKSALAFIMGHLDKDHDGVVSTEERKQARIIIYGHSWGASQTAVLAQRLQQLGIPVLLTVQLDIISKFHQKPTLIPANVVKAINLYQPGGTLHGRPLIVANDSARTTILGNIRMEYGGSKTVSCNNYNWFVRTFNRPHHEIENDPGVWNQVAGLIETTVVGE